ncbi:MAG: hypothetical protein N3F05_01235 [Candidatus Diapherotrites archaeon]|nr:hypothetical protein [Candidatus Diapherotrites archaeon]
MFLLIILSLFSFALFWPKSFSYTDCGNCEMLGVKKNIERIVSIRKNFFGYEIKVIANTCCGIKLAPKTQISKGIIRLHLNALGSNCPMGCLCDKELKINIPSSQELKVIEFYIDDILIDKRSVYGDKLSNGEEFCEQIPSYKERCYTRVAFIKKDLNLCNISGNKECFLELQEYLLLSCLSQKIKSCKEIFSENYKQETI